MDGPSPQPVGKPVCFDVDDVPKQEDEEFERDTSESNSEEAILVAMLPDVLWLSDHIATMRPTRPEIIRAAPVWAVLRGFARPLRQQEGDFFELSRVTTRVQAFWSHSWHGSTCMKIATVFLLNNATAAAVVSTASAFSAFFLVGLGVLPQSSTQHCAWCISSGVLTYVLTMLFWHPPRLVFVDRLCISQSDPVLKAEGLFSLGAILKNSDRMLVLWDRSWTQRLWCVFELAAFLHSRAEGEKPHVTIRPTSLGFIVCAIWLAIALGGLCFTLGLLIEVSFVPFALLIAIGACGAIFFYIAHLVREFCRDVNVMSGQIANFRFAEANSDCCSRDHKEPGSGKPMICDRAVMQRCIGKWFGSIGAFEQRVHGEVRDLLFDQLSHHVFSYGRLVEASPVLFWVYLDRAAVELWLGWQFGHSLHSYGVFNILYGLTYWLALCPIFFRILFHLAWMLQAERSCRLADLFINLVLLLAGILPFSALIFSQFFILRPFGPILYSLISFIVAALTWHCLPTVPRREGPSPAGLESTGPRPNTRASPPQGSEVTRAHTTSL